MNEQKSTRVERLARLRDRIGHVFDRAAVRGDWDGADRAMRRIRAVSAAIAGEVTR